MNFVFFLGKKNTQNIIIFTRSFPYSNIYRAQLLHSNNKRNSYNISSSYDVRYISVLLKLYNMFKLNDLLTIFLSSQLLNGELLWPDHWLNGNSWTNEWTTSAG